MNRIKSKWHGALSYDKADMMVPVYEPTPTYTSGSAYDGYVGPTYVDGKPVYTEPEVTASTYPLYKEPEIVSPYRPDPLLDTVKPEITGVVKPTIEKPEYGPDSLPSDDITIAKPIEASVFNQKTLIIIGAAILGIFIIKKLT